MSKKPTMAPRPSASKFGAPCNGARQNPEIDKGREPERNQQNNQNGSRSSR